MITRSLLDHILLGCSDLDAGIAFVKQHTGAHAIFGGVHPGRGTRNAILSLGELHYLEIIAPDPKQAGIQQWPVQGVSGLKSSPRLIGWAVHTDDLDALAGKVRESGLVALPISPGSRKRDDSRVLNWKTLNLSDDRKGLLPFFIQWSAGSPHPAANATGGCQLESFLVAVPNPGELTILFHELGVQVAIEHANTPQLRARISGPSGRLEVTS
jgi:Glyoxalase-like domain